MIFAKKNTGKSYYSKYIESKNEELEASITNENITGYCLLLDSHIPKLKGAGMPNIDIPCHMMAFYDIPMSVTLDRLSFSEK